jgi:hypothetical protein
MKHILKQRMNINESERSRILGLHDTFRNKVGGFLHEQNMDEATKFFMDQKTKFNNFPDGKVVPYGNTFGYEVVNTDGTKYILLPNGSSAVDNGTGYKESLGYSWTKTPYVASASVKTGAEVTGAEMKQPSINSGIVNTTTSTGQPTTATGQPTTATGQPTVKPVSFEDLASEKDIRQSNRAADRTKRKDDKQQLKDRETRIKNCNSAINTFINGNLGSKPDTDKTKQQYVNYLKTNCSGIDEIDLTMVGL